MFYILVCRSTYCGGHGAGGAVQTGHDSVGTDVVDVLVMTLFITVIFTPSVHVIVTTGGRAMSTCHATIYCVTKRQSLHDE